MRLLSFFIKTMKENIRDWKILLMTLAFAPVFVLIMYASLSNTNSTYNILVINNDKQVLMKDGTNMDFGGDLVSQMEKVKYPDGTDMLNITKTTDYDGAIKQVQNKSAEMLIVIPEDFSKNIRECIEKGAVKRADIVFHGDVTNAKYMVAAIFTDSIAAEYATAVTGMGKPIEVKEESIGNFKNPSAFDATVPGVLVFSLIMVMFTAASSIIKDVDKGTIKRLRISKLKTFEFLTAISLSQVFVTTAAMALAYLTALGCGFKGQGSLLTVLVIGFVSSFSIVSISLITAAFLRTVFDVMIVGNFPFFILMFFSGGMFPIPTVKLFNLGDHTVNLNSILPTAHTTAALDKVLNYGAGLGDILFEISAIIVLTVFYFIIGVILFSRKHMRSI